MLFEENFSYLKPSDEIKFVIQDRKDFEEAQIWLEKYHLIERFQILFSPLWAKLELAELTQWVLKAKLSVRIQTQLHKWIWGTALGR